MSYESAIIEALGILANPPVNPPAAVAAALAQLTTSVGNWREMHGVSNTSLGEGPSVGLFENKLAQIVSIDLQVYRNAESAAGLAADPMQQRRPMGTGWDFSTRHVPA
jgi:hypothetical protein